MHFTKEIFASLGLSAPHEGGVVRILNQEKLPSFFAVSELAASSFLAFGEALKALLVSHKLAMPPTLEVDQRLASLWFGTSLNLVEGSQPNPWDAIAGDYQCADGWIRLHTNASHHKIAALNVLGVPQNRELVARAVKKWDARALESAIVDAGGCAAQMRSLRDWQDHPQGRAVAAEPLVDFKVSQFEGNCPFSIQNKKAPLEGLRVLDITRVIAGPVATRILAGYGATVLRIDPEDWEEPGLYEDLTIGKNCAHLDLKLNSGRKQFEQLVKDAHVLVHGLRADALEKLGYSRDQLYAINPNLVDVAHNAYGWTGPWKNRRGFDSLVQMSAGIADFGMMSSDAKVPVPLPVQALDHATGYLLAAATLVALKRQKHDGRAISARTSLARVAHLLVQSASPQKHGAAIAADEHDFSKAIEMTHCGPAKRLHSPINLSGIEQSWKFAAGPLRSAPARWPTNEMDIN